MEEILILLFLILIGGTVALHFYYDNKTSLLKRRLVILSSQYAKLKENSLSQCTTKEIKAKFTTPSITDALLNKDSKIYFAPGFEYPVLLTSSESIDVKILDSVFISSLTWYYISLPCSNINNRGWVQEMNIYPK